MALGTSNFAELLWPAIKEIWGDSYDHYPTLYSKFVEVVESELAFEKFQGVTGFSRARIKPQGAPVNYDDPLLGYQKIVEPNVWQIGAVVTREMVDDEQYNYINKLPKFLGESLRQTEEVVCANLLNNGFTATTGTLTADTSTLFNASHLIVDGTKTFRNLPSVTADLTQTSVEQMFIDVGNLVDDRGLNILVKPQRLIVPVDNQFQAEKIMKTQYELDTNNNTVNVIAGRLDVVVNPYLTDTDSWFVKNDLDNCLVMTRRSKAKIERDNEFDTMNMKIFTWCRFGVDAIDARGFYGSAGA